MTLWELRAIVQMGAGREGTGRGVAPWILKFDIFLLIF